MNNDEWLDWFMAIALTIVMTLGLLILVFETIRYIAR